MPNCVDCYATVITKKLLLIFSLNQQPIKFRDLRLFDNSIYNATHAIVS